jgi:hypothetical protein
MAGKGGIARPILWSNRNSELTLDTFIRSGASPRTGVSSLPFLARLRIDYHTGT